MKLDVNCLNSFTLAICKKKKNNKKILRALRKQIFTKCYKNQSFCAHI